MASRSRPARPPYVVKPSVRISSTRIRSASAASRTPSIPPMLTMASFFALIVKPSQSSNISCAIAWSVRSCSAGSSRRMRYEFSAKRHASRKRGPRGAAALRDRCAGCACETAWPPTVLLVTVITTNATSPRVRAQRCVEGVEVHVSAERGARRSASARAGRCPCAPAASTLARVVSKRPLESTTLPAEAARPRRGCAPRRGPGGSGRRMGMPVSSCDGLLEAEPAARAGVGLVAAHHRRPLLGAHRARPGVGEQVDDDVLGAEAEQVVTGPPPGSAAARAAWSCGSARRP